ncbi:MAG: hypothetical protein KY444_06790, partial [Gemmatimonadetes bacterium]|nr:hypothetical protein [Gemmatimonadota bacterium]
MTGAPGNTWPGTAAARHGRSHRGPGLESRVRRVPALRSAVAFAVSFEVVFVLFLFAGRFKTDPRFAWIPIDLTVLFFGLSVMYGAAILVLRGPRLPRRPAMVAVWGLLFAAYASFTLLWAPPEPFPVQKVLQFYTLGLWSLAGVALVIAPERRRVARFGLALLLMAAWVGYEAYLAYTQTSGLFQITAMGSGYLGVGRTVGAGMLVCVCAILFGRALWARLACAAAFGAFGFVLLVLGGRGPLVSAV